MMVAVTKGEYLMNTRSATAFAFSLLVAAAAHGQNAYSSFGPGQFFDPNNGWVISGPQTFVGYDWLACEFTSLASGSLENVTVAASWGGGGNEVNVTLWTESGGSLGTALESWSVINLPTFGNSITPLTLNSVTGAAVSAGSNYFLELSTSDDDSFDIWHTSRVPGTQLYSFDAGASWHPQVGTAQGAFSVTVTPEPASFLVLGLGALPILRRRKRSA
jgi:hypothetical protein